jgi:hypothetical protein
VQIGSVERTTAESPHLGEIIVNGFVHALGAEAESIQAAKINADNYFFRRVPFAPLMRTIPGVSAADQLRAQQLQQQADEAATSKAPEEPPQADGQDKPANDSAPPAAAGAPRSDASPQAE